MLTAASPCSVTLDKDLNYVCVRNRDVDRNSLKYRGIPVTVAEDDKRKW